MGPVRARAAPGYCRLAEDGGRGRDRGRGSILGVERDAGCGLCLSDGGAGKVRNWRIGERGGKRGG